MNSCQNKIKVVFENINRYYGKTKILDNINLHISEGELVAIVGPSGCGKSTIFNIIAGLLKPDAGKVIYRGEDITGKSGIISYSFQKDLLLPYMTIEENVALPLLIKKEKKADALVKANEMLKEFKLDAYAKKYPKELSGGMRQRIALLRTYLFSKDVSLLDEPFSALDAITKDEMHDWYMNMRRKYKTSTIFITHDVDEAIYLGTRVIVMAPRPGVIKEDIKIDMEYPRNRNSDEFIEHRKHILDVLNLSLIHI